MWFKVRISKGDSTVLLFFFFAMEMCQHLPCRFVSYTFFEGACCVRFLQYCDISVFASLLDVYRSRYQTLECNGTVFCVHMQGCVHLKFFCIVAIVSFLSNFVCLTMGCLVVTEPFDLTSLVEDTRSPFQIGCKLFSAASASQHGWAHS